MIAPHPYHYMFLTTHCIVQTSSYIVPTRSSDG
jgi:hypothetical protein